MIIYVLELTSLSHYLKNYQYFCRSAGIVCSNREKEFRKCFQINRENFQALIQSMRTFSVCDEVMGAIRNSIIEPEVRIAVMIQVLALALMLNLY